MVDIPKTGQNDDAGKLDPSHDAYSEYQAYDEATPDGSFDYESAEDAYVQSADDDDARQNLDLGSSLQRDALRLGGDPYIVSDSLIMASEVYRADPVAVSQARLVARLTPGQPVEIPIAVDNGHTLYLKLLYNAEQDRFEVTQKNPFPILRVTGESPSSLVNYVLNPKTNYVDLRDDSRVLAVLIEQGEDRQRRHPIVMEGDELAIVTFQQSMPSRGDLSADLDTDEARAKVRSDIARDERNLREIQFNENLTKNGLDRFWQGPQQMSFTIIELEQVGGMTRQRPLSHTVRYPDGSEVTFAVSQDGRGYHFGGKTPLHGEGDLAVTFERILPDGVRERYVGSLAVKIDSSGPFEVLTLSALPVAYVLDTRDGVVWPTRVKLSNGDVSDKLNAEKQQRIAINVQDHHNLSHQPWLVSRASSRSENIWPSEEQVRESVYADPARHEANNPFFVMKVDADEIEQNYLYLRSKFPDQMVDVAHVMLNLESDADFQIMLPYFSHGGETIQLDTKRMAVLKFPGNKFLEVPITVSLDANSEPQYSLRVVEYGIDLEIHQHRNSYFYVVSAGADTAVHKAIQRQLYEDFKAAKASLRFEDSDDPIPIVVRSTEEDKTLEFPNFQYAEIYLGFSIQEEKGGKKALKGESARLIENPNKGQTNNHARGQIDLYFTIFTDINETGYQLIPADWYFYNGIAYHILFPDRRDGRQFAVALETDTGKIVPVDAQKVIAATRAELSIPARELLLNRLNKEVREREVTYQRAEDLLNVSEQDVAAGKGEGTTPSPPSIGNVSGEPSQTEITQADVAAAFMNPEQYGESITDGLLELWPDPLTLGMDRWAHSLVPGTKSVYVTLTPQEESTLRIELPVQVLSPDLSLPSIGVDEDLPVRLYWRGQVIDDAYLDATNGLRIGHATLDLDLAIGTDSNATLIFVTNAVAGSAPEERWSQILKSLLDQFSLEAANHDTAEELAPVVSSVPVLNTNPSSFEAGLVGTQIGNYHVLLDVAYNEATDEWHYFRTNSREPSHQGQQKEIFQVGFQLQNPETGFYSYGSSYFHVQRFGSYSVLTSALDDFALYLVFDHRTGRFFSLSIQKLEAITSQHPGPENVGKREQALIEFFDSRQVDYPEEPVAGLRTNSSVLENLFVHMEPNTAEFLFASLLSDLNPQGRFGFDLYQQETDMRLPVTVRVGGDGRMIWDDRSGPLEFVSPVGMRYQIDSTGIRFGYDQVAKSGTMMIPDPLRPEFYYQITTQNWQLIAHPRLIDDESYQAYLNEAKRVRDIDRRRFLFDVEESGRPFPIHLTAMPEVRDDSVWRALVLQGEYEIAFELESFVDGKDKLWRLSASGAGEQHKFSVRLFDQNRQVEEQGAWTGRLVQDKKYITVVHFEKQNIVMVFDRNTGNFVFVDPKVLNTPATTPSKEVSRYARMVRERQIEIVEPLVRRTTAIPPSVVEDDVKRTPPPVAEIDPVTDVAPLPINTQVDLAVLPFAVDYLLYQSLGTDFRSAMPTLDGSRVFHVSWEGKEGEPSLALSYVDPVTGLPGNPAALKLIDSNPLQGFESELYHANRAFLFEGETSNQQYLLYRDQRKVTLISVEKSLLPAQRYELLTNTWSGDARYYPNPLDRYLGHLDLETLQVHTDLRPVTLGVNLENVSLPNGVVVTQSLVYENHRFDFDLKYDSENKKWSFVQRANELGEEEIKGTIHVHFAEQGTKDIPVTFSSLDLGEESDFQFYSCVTNHPNSIVMHFVLHQPSGKIFVFPKQKDQGIYNAGHISRANQLLPQRFADLEFQYLEETVQATLEVDTADGPPPATPELHDRPLLAPGEILTADPVAYNFARLAAFLSPEQPQVYALENGGGVRFFTHAYYDTSQERFLDVDQVDGFFDDGETSYPATPTTTWQRGGTYVADPMQPQVIHSIYDQTFLIAAGSTSFAALKTQLDRTQQQHEIEWQRFLSGQTAQGEQLPIQLTALPAKPKNGEETSRFLILDESYEIGLALVRTEGRWVLRSMGDQIIFTIYDQAAGREMAAMIGYTAVFAGNNLSVYDLEVAGQRLRLVFNHIDGNFAFIDPDFTANQGKNLSKTESNWRNSVRGLQFVTDAEKLSREPVRADEFDDSSQETPTQREVAAAFMNPDRHPEAFPKGVVEMWTDLLQQSWETWSHIATQNRETFYIPLVSEAESSFRIEMPFLINDAEATDEFLKLDTDSPVRLMWRGQVLADTRIEQEGRDYFIVHAAYPELRLLVHKDSESGGVAFVSSSDNISDFVEEWNDKEQEKRRQFKLDVAADDLSDTPPALVSSVPALPNDPENLQREFVGVQIGGGYHVTMEVFYDASSGFWQYTAINSFPDEVHHQQIYLNLYNPSTGESYRAQTTIFSLSHDGEISYLTSLADLAIPHLVFDHRTGRFIPLAEERLEKIERDAEPGQNLSKTKQYVQERPIDYPDEPLDGVDTQLPLLLQQSVLKRDPIDYNVLRLFAHLNPDQNYYYDYAEATEVSAGFGYRSALFVDGTTGEFFNRPPHEFGYFFDSDGQMYSFPQDEVVFEEGDVPTHEIPDPRVSGILHGLFLEDGVLFGRPHSLNHDEAMRTYNLHVLEEKTALHKFLYSTNGNVKQDIALTPLPSKESGGWRAMVLSERTEISFYMQFDAGAERWGFASRQVDGKTQYRVRVYDQKLNLEVERWLTISPENILLYHKEALVFKIDFLDTYLILDRRSGRFIFYPGSYDFSEETSGMNAKDQARHFIHKYINERNYKEVSFFTRPALGTRELQEEGELASVAEAQPLSPGIIGISPERYLSDLLAASIDMPHWITLMDSDQGIQVPLGVKWNPVIGNYEAGVLAGHGIRGPFNPAKGENDLYEAMTIRSTSGVIITGFVETHPKNSDRARLHLIYTNLNRSFAIVSDGWEKPEDLLTEDKIIERFSEHKTTYPQLFEDITKRDEELTAFWTSANEFVFDEDQGMAGFRLSNGDVFDIRVAQEVGKPPSLFIASPPEERVGDKLYYPVYIRYTAKGQPTFAGFTLARSMVATWEFEILRLTATAQTIVFIDGYVIPIDETKLVGKKPNELLKYFREEKSRLYGVDPKARVITEKALPNDDWQDDKERWPDDVHTGLDTDQQNDFEDPSQHYPQSPSGSSHYYKVPRTNDDPPKINVSAKVRSDWSEIVKNEFAKWPEAEARLPDGLEFYPTENFAAEILAVELGYARVHSKATQPGPQYVSLKAIGPNGELYTVSVPLKKQKDVFVLDKNPKQGFSRAILTLPSGTQVEFPIFSINDPLDESYNYRFLMPGDFDSQPFNLRMATGVVTMRTRSQDYYLSQFYSRVVELHPSKSQTALFEQIPVYDDDKEVYLTRSTFPMLNSMPTRAIWQGVEFVSGAKLNVLVEPVGTTGILKPRVQRIGSGNYVYVQFFKPNGEKSEGWIQVYEHVANNGLHFIDFRIINVALVFDPKVEMFYHLGRVQTRDATVVREQIDDRTHRLIYPGQALVGLSLTAQAPADPGSGGTDRPPSPPVATPPVEEDRLQPVQGKEDVQEELSPEQKAERFLNDALPYPRTLSSDPVELSRLGLVASLDSRGQHTLILRDDSGAQPLMVSVQVSYDPNRAMILVNEDAPVDTTQVAGHRFRTYREVLETHGPSGILAEGNFPFALSELDTATGIGMNHYGSQSPFVLKFKTSDIVNVDPGEDQYYQDGEVKSKNQLKPLDVPHVTQREVKAARQAVMDYWAGSKGNAKTKSTIEYMVLQFPKPEGKADVLRSLILPDGDRLTFALDLQGETYSYRLDSEGQSTGTIRVIFASKFGAKTVQGEMRYTKFHTVGRFQILEFPNLPGLVLDTKTGDMWFTHIAKYSSDFHLKEPKRESRKPILKRLEEEQQTKRFVRVTSEEWSRRSTQAMGLGNDDEPQNTAPPEQEEPSKTDQSHEEQSADSEVIEVEEPEVTTDDVNLESQNPSQQQEPEIVVDSPSDTTSDVTQPGQVEDIQAQEDDAHPTEDTPDVDTTQTSPAPGEQDISEEDQPSKNPDLQSEEVKSPPPPFPLAEALPAVRAQDLPDEWGVGENDLPNVVAEVDLPASALPHYQLYGAGLDAMEQAWWGTLLTRKPHRVAMTGTTRPTVSTTLIWNPKTQQTESHGVTISADGKTEFLPFVEGANVLLSTGDSLLPWNLRFVEDPVSKATYPVFGGTLAMFLSTHLLTRGNVSQFTALGQVLGEYAYQTQYIPRMQEYQDVHVDSGQGVSVYKFGEVVGQSLFENADALSAGEDHIAVEYGNGVTLTFKVIPIKDEHDRIAWQFDTQESDTAVRMEADLPGMRRAISGDLPAEVLGYLGSWQLIFVQEPYPVVYALDTKSRFILPLPRTVDPQGGNWTTSSTSTYLNFILRTRKGVETHSSSLEGDVFIGEDLWRDNLQIPVVVDGIPAYANVSWEVLDSTDGILQAVVLEETDPAYALKQQKAYERGFAVITFTSVYGGFLTAEQAEDVVAQVSDTILTESLMLADTVQLQSEGLFAFVESDVSGLSITSVEAVESLEEAEINRTQMWIYLYSGDRIPTALLLQTFARESFGVVSYEDRQRHLEILGQHNTILYDNAIDVGEWLQREYRRDPEAVENLIARLQREYPLMPTAEVLVFELWRLHDPEISDMAFMRYSIDREQFAADLREARIEMMVETTVRLDPFARQSLVDERLREIEEVERARAEAARQTQRARAMEAMPRGH